MGIPRILLRFLPLTVASVVLAIMFACTNGNGGEETTQPTSEVTPGPEVTPDAEVTPPPGPIPFLSPPPPVSADGNVLPIAGFEQCSDALPEPCAPWFALKPPNFELSETAYSGDKSAALRMREGESAEGIKIFYLVQEVAPTEFPEVLSGFYRVENWLRGTEKQYLQFVIIVVRADNAPRAVNAPEAYSNHQIRYILTGIDEEPFAISNAKFVFLGDKEPPEDEWVPFQVNVKQDFLDLWGAVPEGYDFIRLLYEVRVEYPDGEQPVGPAEADVFYDDLHFGPAEGAPSP